jgi:hypothetical protein
MTQSIKITGYTTHVKVKISVIEFIIRKYEVIVDIHVQTEKHFCNSFD